MTAFSERGTETRPVEWWTDIVGLPPDSTISRLKVGLHQQDGIFEGRKLILQVQPDRIDWLLLPITSELPEELPESMPSAGPFPEALSSFQKPALAWLKIAPIVRRLAFGAVLTQTIEDRRAGYTELAKYLPFPPDPDASDFLYQINRPRESKTGVPGLHINRLMKWSVLLFRRFEMSLEKKGPARTLYSGEQSACRLELDINTVPTFPDELPREALDPLFRELIALGIEIAEKGDIP